MVHVGQSGGIPVGIDQFRFLTANDGKKWTKTPAGHGGNTFGVLLDGTIAEAWDNHVYGDADHGHQPQEIRFRIADLP